MDSTAMMAQIVSTHKSWEQKLDERDWLVVSHIGRQSLGLATGLDG